MSKNTDKKQSIINAAVRVISEKGYFNTTTRDIIKEANISTGNLYHYFKSKEQIMLTIFENLYEYISELDKQLKLGEQTPDKKTYTRINYMIKYFSENPGIFRIIYIEANNFIFLDEVHQNKLIELWNKTFAFGAKLLSEAKDKGYFNFKGDEETVVKIVMSSIQGFLAKKLFFSKNKNISQKEIDILIKFIFNGLQYKGELFNEK